LVTKPAGDCSYHSVSVAHRIAHLLRITKIRVKRGQPRPIFPSDPLKPLVIGIDDRNVNIIVTREISSHDGANESSTEDGNSVHENLQRPIRYW
jgi:hypothetical protein